MKPRDRAISAIELRQPDDIVPTFEFSFDLTRDLLGRDFVNLKGLSGNEHENAVKHNAELHIELAERLDWSIITEGNPEVIKELVRLKANDKYLLCVKDGDASYRFYGEGSGNNIISHLYDNPDEFKSNLSKGADGVIESSKRLIELGVECFVMGADYAGTTGPFLSPNMFGEFVKPYLYRMIAAYRQNGAYVIKHTDGYIMPIIEQILECQPHALQSIDPISGMDIAEVKKLYGDRVCLVGNVDCAALVSHDKEKIRQSAMYSLKYGMTGGGYIFSSSNSIFRPMTIEDYLFMLEIRNEYGIYGNNR